MLYDLIIGVPLAIIFQPPLQGWFGGFGFSVEVGNTPPLQQMLFPLTAVTVGLLIATVAPIRRGMGILALKYVRNQLMAYQEKRHYLLLTLLTFVIGFALSASTIAQPTLTLWSYLTPYHMGYFIVLSSLLIYSTGRGSEQSNNPLGSEWFALSLPLILGTVLLSQLFGTTPFIWVFFLFFHALRLPLWASFYYGVSSVIAYYTFYILYGTIFLSYGFPGFNIVSMFALLAFSVFLVVIFRFMMSPLRVSILSLLCFYLGVGYLLWV